MEDGIVVTSAVMASTISLYPRIFRPAPEIYFKTEEDVIIKLVVSI